MKEKFSLKDALFNQERVEYLGKLFQAVDLDFNNKKFTLEVVKRFPELELKARIVWIAEVLERYLPSDPRQAMTLIVATLPPPLDPALSDDDFGQFILAPLGEYVVRNGLNKKHLVQSLTTLHEITMRFSMEDAMRSFLNTFPEETFSAYEKWVRDKHYHVRRLVSESTRPLLPWSRRLTMDYHIPLQYLDHLYADRARYVTRSVANHLNDISKREPNLVVATLSRWKKEGRQDPMELAWMTRHSLRTLVKQGNQAALTQLGYTDTTAVEVTKFTLEPTPRPHKRGDTIAVNCEVVATLDCVVMIDYVIDFVKAGGTQKPKVFKWKKFSLKAGETAVLTKNHHFKADATTFKLYPGTHTITLQINGKKMNSFDILLS